MALLMFRGFEETADGTYADTVQKNGGTAGSFTSCVVMSTTARTGTKSIYQRSGSQGRWEPQTPLTTLIFGCAFRNPEQYWSGQPIFYTAATTGTGLAATDLGPWLDHNGSTLYLKDGSGAVLGSVAHAPGAAWAYYEIKVVLTGADGMGSVTARVDGVEFASVSNVQVMGDPTNNSIARVTFRANGYSSYGQYREVYWDDVYACDGAGAAPYNTFLGTIFVPLLRPDAAGAHNAWDGSDGDSVDNHLLVDDVPMDQSVDWVEGNGSGVKQSFGFDALPPEATKVFAVKPVAYIGADAGKSGAVDSFLRTGGADYADTSHGFSSTYAGKVGLLHTVNPATGVAWTPAEVDALELGFQIP